MTMRLTAMITRAAPTTIGVQFLALSCAPAGGVNSSSCGGFCPASPISPDSTTAMQSSAYLDNASGHSVPDSHVMRNDHYQSIFMTYGICGSGEATLDSEQILVRDDHSPAMVMPSMCRVGQAIDERNSKSLPISTMLLSISFRLPATVISSTG